ncbi:CopD family protein [Piscinibacter koreensis]|uniref:CopD family protein n=1 Tax=Piscinibacter koreensis TaxID=2742824 RepID=A0A7Y6TZ40_9BURK|nr:CopD family protein [Schlegelella koreensis]
MDGAGLRTYQLVVTVAINVALAAVAGSLSALNILARGDSAWSRSRASSIEGVLFASTAIALGSAILGLWILSAVITELPLLASAGSIGRILLQTHAGRAWAVGAAALVVLLLLLRARRARPRRSRVLAVGAVCAVVFAGSRSWTSHAGATGDLLVFAIDWAHLVSVSVWAGMVGISASLVLRDPLPQYFREKGECAQFVQILSDTATGSLVVLFVTGIFSSWRSLGGSAAPLVSSSYGSLLLAKLALVAVAVGLGAHNRIATMPVLLALLGARNSTFSGPYRRFVLTLSSESRILLAILVLASILSLSSPP